MYGAAAGMVDALGDTGHSRFMNPEEAKTFNESSEGQFVGIGIQLDYTTGQPVIAFRLTAHRPRRPDCDPTTSSLR